MKPFKLLGYILLSVILIAVFTNPSYKSFEEFSKENNELELKRFVLRKRSNYLIFSVYEKERYHIEYSIDEWYEKDVYYGYLLNFHLVDKIKGKY
jgi:hypothetical protein